MQALTLWKKLLSLQKGCKMKKILGIKDVTETNDFEEKNTEEEIEDNGNPFLE